MKGTLSVNVKHCTACRTCEVECAVAHSSSKDLLHALKESPSPRRRIRVKASPNGMVIVQCRHCHDAPCIAACPKEALARLAPGEPVLVKEELCDGCLRCTRACPYGAIIPTGRKQPIVKCDLCIERLEAGQEPACAAGCPTGAIEFIPEEQLDSREYLVMVSPREEEGSSE